VSAPLDRAAILPEAELPSAAELIAEGRKAVHTHTIGHSAFHEHYGVESEAEYKRRRMADGHVMLHAQIGFRDPDKSRRAFAEIYEAVDKAGYRVDRYGICLDWSMGYPAASRADMPKGTGLILESVEELVAMTAAAPVAAHFGDFVIGCPAAFENAAAALAGGSTSIGNLGQYFTFRQPHWDDDVGMTAASLKAIALTAAQPVEVLVHSNLCDGIGALFSDLACTLGTVLIEKYLIDELIGGKVAHCFGNTFAKPYKRLAFQRACARVTDTPGTLLAGATTMYGADHLANYAALANYIRIDALAQKGQPTGHGIQPIPVTEAERIPDIDEIIDVHLFANRAIELDEPFDGMYDLSAFDEIAERIVEGGQRFKTDTLKGLGEAGIDIADPFELMLAIRRVGPKRLEELFGPGAAAPGRLRGRLPVERSTSIEEMEDSGEGFAAALAPEAREAIRLAGLRGCLATTDVHEYAKIMLGAIFDRLEIEVIDGGLSTDFNALAGQVADGEVAFIALSSYNGVALDYIRDLRTELARRGVDVPIFIGGKLNRIPDGSNTSLPVDVGAEIGEAGAIVCRHPNDMLDRLTEMAVERLSTTLERTA
jgi:methylmalonyl-CoA mutase cobalamin-binding subunit